MNVLNWVEYSTRKKKLGLSRKQNIFQIFTPSSCHDEIILAEIDHCADGTHGCEQEFMNTEDACVCKCRQGFKLRPDGKTCKSECFRL